MLPSVFDQKVQENWTERKLQGESNHRFSALRAVAVPQRYGSGWRRVIRHVYLTDMNRLVRIANPMRVAPIGANRREDVMRTNWGKIGGVGANRGQYSACTNWCPTCRGSYSHQFNIYMVYIVYNIYIYMRGAAGAHWCE